MASDSQVADSSRTDAKKSKPIDVITIIGRQADASDVPGSAHVIDTESLAEFNASDILRVLRSVPGVYVQEEEGFGLRPNIGIRGSGLDRSARIALLEDGILIAPAPYAASSAYYFPTQRRMSGIEVLKGPAAVTVGPRTTGGAINLISTPIPATTTANADIRVAGDNTLDAHLNVGGSGESLGWLLETVQASTDGFKIIDSPAGGKTGYDLSDTILKLRYDTKTASGISHSVSMKLGHAEQDSNETYLGLTRDDFEADPYRRYAASANDRFDSTHKQVQLGYSIDADSFWRATASLYRNDFSRNWYKLQSVGGSSLSAVLEDPDTFGAEYRYLTGGNSPDDALQIRANKRDYNSQGLQGRVEWDFGIGDAVVQLNTGFRLHEDEEDRFQHQDGFRMEEGLLVQTTFAAPGSQTNRVSTADVTALFVDADVRVGNWILTPGVRHENIRLTRFDYATSDPTRAAGPTQVRSNSTSVLIPGFGALYKLNADWRLLAGVHRGYNPPAPGSSAAAEKSINVEAGFRFDNDTMQAEAILFHNDYENLVGTVTESTGGGGQVGDQFDGGEARVGGLELSVGSALEYGEWRIPAEIRYTWTSLAEFQNSFESDFEPWGNVNAGDRLPYIPEHQLRLTSGVEFKRLRASVAANYVGAMRAQAGSGSIDANNGVESHVVWDFYGAWNIASAMSLYVKVDNLFDKDYVASQRPAGLRPGLPRTAYLGLTLTL